MSQIEKKLTSLGLELPPPPPTGGIYQPVLISGSYLYASGHGPFLSDGTIIKGIVGKDLGVEEAKQAAVYTGLSMLASMKAALGDLDRVHRLVKTLGMVNSTPEFQQQPQVINGFSELMRDLWGPDLGIGARSAVGMMLPINLAVEIEAIFELKSE